MTGTKVGPVLSEAFEVDMTGRLTVTSDASLDPALIKGALEEAGYRLAPSWHASRSLAATYTRRGRPLRPTQRTPPMTSTPTPSAGTALPTIRVRRALHQLGAVW